MVELNYDDLMAGAQAITKIPGASPGTGAMAGAGGIEPLTGSFGERVVQALNIVNQILSQWSTLSQDPTFRNHILARFGGGGGMLNPGMGGSPPPGGLSEQEMAGMIRAMMASTLAGFIKQVGDKTINELINDFGQVKLSQLLMLLRGGT